MSKKKHYNGQNGQNLQQEKKENRFRTSSGFEYELNTKNLQDVRFLDALVEMEDPSTKEEQRVVSMIRVIRMILGTEQKDALYARIEKQYGWVPPAAVAKELKDIIGNLSESKKK